MEIDEALSRWLEEDCTLTLNNIRNRISHDFQVNVALNTIKNWLDGKLFSLKSIRPHIGSMNSSENKRKRKEYVEKVLQCRSNNRTLIWIDETNFNLYCRRKEGRSKIGQRASIINPTCKGSNLQCIGAISSSKIIAFEHRRGSFKAVDFKLWFRQLINTCINEGILRPTFIIDNAPAHSNLESIITTEDDVELLRLAPYSYLLNPIELLWSTFKSTVKHEIRNKMDEILAYSRNNRDSLTISEFRIRILENIASASIQHTTQQQLLGYANHVERYYAAALREEDIVEL